jgi:hypothetical protein
MAAAMAAVDKCSCCYWAAAAQAHHSKAMFDNDKCATIEGTMRSFEWVYPHAWLWIVVHNS